MFTGIVEELGTVVAIEHGEDSARLTVAALLLDETVHGDSIAVDGCCLTVAGIAQPELGSRGRLTFTADVMRETLDRTTLGRLAAGDEVNLERSVPPLGRLGGHLVQGHVDGVGRITARTPGDRWEVVNVAVPADLARYLAMKGSVAVDGVSLTVAALDDAAGTFAVSLIPTTLERTTLGNKRVGETVNIEVDVIAKYVERLLTKED